jgi:hypothetical protein
LAPVRALSGVGAWFAEIDRIRTEYGAHRNFEIDLTRLRVRNLLRKLVPKPLKGRKDKSIDNYKGACSEIVDAFQTIKFRRAGMTRISVPKQNKKFDTEDGCTASRRSFRTASRTGRFRAAKTSTRSALRPCRSSTTTSGWRCSPAGPRATTRNMVL